MAFFFAFLGLLVLAKKSEILSRLKRDNVDSRFFFANLGTRWAQIISNWLEQVGKPRVLTNQESDN
jgi:hypothetical protein